MASKAPVFVLGGETGSGKTTQVPQLIADTLLENASKAGRDLERPIEIVVTQPRRVAAISVAQRVAAERGEKIGDSVGYTVRLESVVPTAPVRIVFCTTGVLLRRLVRDPELIGECNGSFTTGPYVNFLIFV